MKYSKIFASSALVLFALAAKPSIAQQQVLFKIKFSPNKTYTMEMTNDMKMEMDLPDSAMRSSVMAKGMKLPMHLDMLQEMSITTRTGAGAADGRIPVTISYDKVGTSVKMEGKEMKKPDNLAGMKIKGHVAKDGKLSVDEIEGNIAPEMKKSIENTVSQMLKSVNFPDKAMKIGDTFSQEMPMVIPTAAGTMSLVVKANYVLKEIKAKQAFFDYTQDISMDFKVDQGKSTASGSGAGRMIYDIPTNYITETTGDMKLDMTVAVGEMVMKINANGKTLAKSGVL